MITGRKTLESIEEGGLQAPVVGGCYHCLALQHGRDQILESILLQIPTQSRSSIDRPPTLTVNMPMFVKSIICNH